MQIHTFWQKVANLSPRTVLLTTAVLCIISVLLALRIGFSFQFDDFFPKADDELSFYYEYREKFAPDDNFLLVGFEVDQLFDSVFLHRLDSATYRFNRLEQVDRALSVAGYRYLIKSPFGYLDYPAIHLNAPDRYPADSLRLLKDERVMGKLVAEDFGTTIIFIQTKDSLNQQDNVALLDGIHSILEQQGLSDYHLIGKAFFEVELVRFQKKEFLTYSILSILCVSLVIFLLFRNWRTVALAIVTVTVCLILFLGFLGATGRILNVMSSLFPIIIIIVGISDVVHFLSRYIAELHFGEPRRTALYKTLKDVGFATFLTSVTTAIGFLTLLTSKIPPIREFGLLAAGGVIMAYFVTLFFTAPMFLLFGKEELAAKGNRQRSWSAWMQSVYLSGKNHPRRTVIITLLVAAAGCYGTSLITTDIMLRSGLPRNTKVTDDFLFFEEQFNGFRPIEIAAMAQDGYHITDPEVLLEVNKFEARAAASPIINGLQSLTVFYKSMNRAMQGDAPEAYIIPKDTSRLALIQKDLDRFAGKEMEQFVTMDTAWGRISGFVSDAGTDSIQAIQNALMEFARTSIDTNKVQFKITGTGVIFDKNNEYIRDSIIYGILIALIVISLLMGALYKDTRLLIIAIIPNTIPLLICGALLGFLGLTLDAPTAIIFGISYGIVVDDTIHFLSRFKIELDKGATIEAAIEKTFQETGKAIIITSLILFFGFSVLMLSPLQATFNVGMLIGVTLLTAVIADLYLLPLLLRKWLR